MKGRLDGRGVAACFITVVWVACAAPAPPGSIAVAKLQSPPAPRRAPDVCAIRARSGTPPDFVLDGAVSEWTLEDAPRPPRPPPGTRDEDAEPAPMRNAASHVVVALDPSRLLVAGDLSGDATSGIWIGIGFATPALPTIGTWTNGGGVNEAFCHEPGDVFVGTTTVVTAEDKAECDAEVAEAAAFAARHDARFRRLYFIDADGVRARSADGAALVAGAQLRWKPRAGGVTFEAELPLLALPRSGEAPLGHVALFATPGPASTLPAADDSSWRAAELDPPVAFEPFAEIRSAYLESERMLAYVNGALSYQPGEPNAVERAGYVPQEEFPFRDMMKLEIAHEKLVERTRKFRDLDVGRIAGRGTAVWRGEQLLGSGAGGGGNWVEIDGQLFSIGSSTWVSDETWTDGARFSALAITPEGAIREDLVQTPAGFLYWRHVEEVSNGKDWKTLIIRGNAAIDSGRDNTTTVTWTYSPKTRDYRPKVVTVLTP